MSEFKGYFLGFTFRETHSSDLKIVRVNTGNRFNSDLFPQFKDSTVEIVGRDGLVYYNTQIQQYQISLNFAYDSVTETEIKKIRELFSPMVVGKLIFDEYPYKEYTAKVTTGAKLSYIVFNEGKDNERIYKGEGSVTFTCFYPYARAPFKTLEEYSDEFGKIAEWSDISGILNSSEFNSGQYDILSSNNNSWKVYNPGDKESPLTLTFTVANGGIIANPLIISYTEGNTRLQTLCLDGSQFEENTTIIIDSEKKAIYTASDMLDIKNGSILAGDFIKIPTTNSSNKGTQEVTINNIQGMVIGNTNLKINYPYLYI